jgi:pimeloyl-ACP methyl ester carboxylesterase
MPSVTIASAILATALALTACSTPRPGKVRPPGRIAWHDCAQPAVAHLTFACGTVKVPLNWADTSDGKTLDIAVIRARSSEQTRRIGSLLLNPGGPGISGFDLPAQVARFAPELAKRFDLVSFDPRGVGRSGAIRCRSDADLDHDFGVDPEVQSPAALDSVLSSNRTAVTKCVDRYGAALSLYSTTQTARDMDAIRAALGEDRISYLGFSYGTLLGTVYAELFPTRIRAMALDGIVDPHGERLDDDSEPKNFERALDNFSAWCGQACAIGPNARATVVEAVRQARVHPVKDRNGREATAGWVFNAIFWSLYFRASWPSLVTAIEALSHGKPDQILDLADQYAGRDSTGHYDDVTDARLVIDCNDFRDRPSIEQVHSLQVSWHKAYPFFGDFFAMDRLSCALWPPARDPVPVGPANGAPPILVIGTKGDPATAYENAQPLATMLGTGTVLTWEDGNTHTAYLYGIPCITSAVDRYLIDLQTPVRGMTCRTESSPSPTGTR